jgi:hypothetical protein
MKIQTILKGLAIVMMATGFAIIWFGLKVIEG